MRKPNIQNLLSKFAAQEESFLLREFLAPKLSGVDVNVRIAGAICRMRTRPARYEGFGVFQPKSLSEAQYVRDATLTERSCYLQQLPRVGLVVEGRVGNHWVGRAANRSDTRLQIDGSVAIEFAFDIEAFDIVHVRFDGRRFWFDELDMRHSPSVAVNLRHALDAQVHPRDLNVAGASSVLRDLYLDSYRHRYEPVPNVVADREQDVRHSGNSSSASDREDLLRHRLHRNLSHAGAELVGYAEHGDGFRVTYTVDGQEYVSSIDKTDFTVQSAGFCLDEMDRDFDLASLVGVVREGWNGDRIEHD